MLRISSFINRPEGNCEFKCDFKTIFELLCNSFLREMSEGVEKWLTHFQCFITGILLPKLFWPTVGRNCSSDREKLLKFEAEGRESANFLRSPEQFVRTVKGQHNIW